MSGEFLNQSRFGCAGCETPRAMVNNAGFCAKCASPEGVTITEPRGPSLMDAAKTARDTLQRLDASLIISMLDEGEAKALATSLALLHAAITYEEKLRGDND